MYLNDDHTSFQNKPADNESVWRYMDIARYVALLETEALYFSRADHMSDKWEGSLDYLSLRDAGIKESEKFERQTFTNYISCWQASEYESAAMWDVYQKEGRAVAVNTTWSRLTQSLLGPWTVRGGRVNYVDYRNHRIPLDNQYSRFMYKRQSFDFEKEARLILWAEAPGGPAWDPTDDSPIISSSFSKESAPIGLNVPVDLEKLIRWVYVAPGSPPWIPHLISAINRRYGHLNWEVVATDLGSERLT
jgi:hypothetical protein